MTLVKLLIWPDVGLPAAAMFNPQQIAISKSVPWKRQGTKQRDGTSAQFTHGEPRTLSMELFFDTYELKLDVRLLTTLVERLTMVQGPIHRPPICRLIWGTGGVFFTGMLTQLNQSFTMFLPTGNPVRATLSCSFTEWRSAKEEALLQNLQSPDVAKTRVLCLGDTLSSIAAEEYNDPTLWREIARANQIINPLRLPPPGTLLSIPVLRQGDGRRRSEVAP
jgi:nucleoid-associated protein YgaU